MPGITLKMVGSMAKKPATRRKAAAANPATRRKAAAAPNPATRRKAGDPFIGVKVNAGNDRNGNGRRGWFVFEIQDGNDPRPVGFVDESGMGFSALRAEYGDIPSVGMFDISAKDYANAVRQGAEWIKGARDRSRAMY